MLRTNPVWPQIVREPVETTIIDTENGGKATGLQNARVVTKAFSVGRNRASVRVRRRHSRLAGCGGE